MEFRQFVSFLMTITSLVDTANRLRVAKLEIAAQFSAEGKDFLFSKALSLALGPAQPPTQRVPRTCHRVKRLDRETDKLPPTIAR